MGYLSHYYKILQSSDNLPLQKQRFDFKDDLTETHTYIYDSSGLLSFVVCRSEEDSLMYKMQYSYDDKGNLLQESKMNAFDQETESRLYTYDDSNRLILMLEYNWNPRYGGIPNLRKHCEYSYE
ncbi:MAG: hypothetical protein PHQ78_06025 [Candidatus Cloacimonetes bacterium]|nr:hypothetical protein [Candidatus Cloacimonadota bacterium]MDD4560670.1 hypothetical protein [Candidatus Cloacimonadota bacterium]